MPTICENKRRRGERSGEERRGRGGKGEKREKGEKQRRAGGEGGQPAARRPLARKFLRGARRRLPGLRSRVPAAAAPRGRGRIPAPPAPPARRAARSGARRGRPGLPALTAAGGCSGSSHCPLSSPPPPLAAPRSKSRRRRPRGRPAPTSGPAGPPRRPRAWSHGAPPRAAVERGRDRGSGRSRGEGPRERAPGTGTGNRPPPRKTSPGKPAPAHPAFPRLRARTARQNPGHPVGSQEAGGCLSGGFGVGAVLGVTQHAGHVTPRRLILPRLSICPPFAPLGCLGTQQVPTPKGGRWGLWAQAGNGTKHRGTGNASSPTT